MMVDREIRVEVSFNGQEYFEATTMLNTLEYNEKARIQSIYPTYGFAN